LRAAYFDELYLFHVLVTQKHAVSPVIRKFLIAILLRYIGAFAVFHQNNIFIVKSDYYGSPCTLTSMSYFYKIYLISVQHGVQNPRSILTRKIYPCSRVRLQINFTSQYNNVFSSIGNCRVTNICMSEFTVNDIKDSSLVPYQRPSEVIFISSGLSFHLSSKELLNFFNSLRHYSEVTGASVSVKTHPSESHSDFPTNLSFYRYSTDSLFGLCNSSTVFIGFFSTLLYELFCSGYAVYHLVPPLSNKQYHEDCVAIQEMLPLIPKILLASDLNGDLSCSLKSQIFCYPNHAIKSKFTTLESLVQQLQYLYASHSNQT
jgi:hypothetical protein